MAKTKKTYEEWLEAVEDGDIGMKELMKEIPAEMKTYELCEAAINNALVNNESELLSCLPKDVLDENLIMLAIDRYHQSIYGAPEEMITEELVLYSMNQARKQGGSISMGDYPEKYRSKRLLLEGIKYAELGDKFGKKNFLGYVPDELWKDSEMLSAIAENVDNWLNYAPKSCKHDVNFWRVVVEITGWYLCYVPENLKTLELCIVAVKRELSSPPADQGVEDIFESVPEALREQVKQAVG